MRARDARAIIFCVVTVLALFAAVYLTSRNYLAAVALALAYGAWIMTRARMLRVLRRLRGEADWSGYYKDD